LKKSWNKGLKPLIKKILLDPKIDKFENLRIFFLNSKPKELPILKKTLNLDPKILVKTNTDLFLVLVMLLITTQEGYFT
jgi:hypothetical protein